MPVGAGVSLRLHIVPRVALPIEPAVAEFILLEANVVLTVSRAIAKLIYSAPGRQSRIGLPG